MTISEVSARTPLLVTQLVALWDASVQATHHFLSDEQRLAIKTYVPRAIQAVPHLIVAENGAQQPIAFMGIDGDRLEMLFLAPDERGHGLGRQLLQFGMERYGVRTLTVNEQNPQARGFYEHLGFGVVRRTDLDEAGDPYPLLYMELNPQNAH